MRRIVFSVVCTFITFASFAQLDIVGEYNFQTAMDGVIKKDPGSMKIVKIDDETYDLISKEKGFSEDHNQFTLDGLKLEFLNKNDIQKAQFFDDGSLFYTIQGNPSYISYMAVATKSDKPKKNINKELSDMTVSTRPCPCCKKTYKKNQGYFMYAEYKSANMYTEKQDLLQKAINRYCCSELCAEKHYRGKCKK